MRRYVPISRKDRISIQVYLESLIIDVDNIAMERNLERLSKLMTKREVRK